MTNEIIFVSTTKFANKCAKCGTEIPAGTSCFWEKGSKPSRNFHEQCYRPDALKKPIITSSSVASSGKISGGRATSPEADVSERIVLAKKIVARIFSVDEQDIASDNPMLVEACRELYGQQWLSEMK